MKKLLLLFTLIFLLSCESDRSPDKPIIPDDKIESLEGVVLTPQNNALTGYGQKLEFILKKGTKILTNNNYTWLVSDSLRGRTNVYGHFYSIIIGGTNVVVKDNEGNSLTANVQIDPKINDIPKVPYIKWGAFENEIKNNVSWTQVSPGYYYGTTLIFKTNKIAVKYYVSLSTGLYRVELTDNFSDITGWSEGFTAISKLKDYNNERFQQLNINESNYYGYNKWWFINPIDNKKVYTYISGSVQQGPYLLKYEEN